MGRGYSVLNYRTVLRYRRFPKFAGGLNIMATFVEMLSPALTAGSGTDTSEYCRS